VLVLVAATLHELRDDVLGVEFFERRDVAHFRGHRITDPAALSVVM
jgi:hypothetical protein